jgi:hypothetical protein
LTLRSKPNAITHKIAAAIMMPLSILRRWPDRELGYQFRPDAFHDRAYFIGNDFDYCGVENETVNLLQFDWCH